MKKHLIFVTLFLLLSQFSIGQKNKKLVHWEENRPLIWKDFKGKAVNSSFYHATTYGILKPGFEPITNRKYRFTLEVLFDTRKSWVKKGKGTDELLKHEQYHFNIFELYARIFIKNLEETNALSGEQFSNKVNKVFKKTFKELTKFQKEYDQATNHSKNEIEQKKWELKIESLLIKHKAYAKRTIVFDI